MPSRRRAFLVLLLCIAVGVLVLNLAIGMRRPLHATIAPRVLVFDVPGQVDEGPPPPTLSFDFLRRERPTFHELLFALRNAADDRSVTGLVLHVDGLDWGWARVYEMSDAVRAFRASGKPVYASLDGGGEKEYLLAAAAGTLAMPPVSTLQLDGLSASAMFMQGAYAKLGIKPNFAHVGRYKSAVEQYTRDSLSPDARVAMEALLDDEFSLLVDSLASARHLAPDSVRRLIDDGPYTAREAHERGLLDTLLAEADVDSLGSRAGGARHPTASFLRYAEEGGAGTGEHIALVVAEGEIVDGRSREGPFGGRSVGDRTLVEALQDIRDHRNIRAVVLRIDSPGGSGDASDAVWQELRRLRREKPIIVSMGDVAASGGYYLACAGDAIVAGPATITGSIGVFGGKLNLLGLYRKLGLNIETVSRGKHAEMLSPFRDFDTEELGRYQQSLDQFYRVFLSRVAEGRKMTPSLVDSVGQGRVWSGLAAKQRGLVDRFGGIHEAFEIARKRAHISSDANIVVDVYPRPRRTFVQRWLGGLFEEPDQDDSRLPALSEIGHWYQVAMFPAGAMLALMPYTIRIQ
ncbi:MAG TPA: signal peptide peptidase SppA [Candidatus Eisenbacteria bacterium]|jgi:protease-4